MRSLLTKAPFEQKSLDLNDVARETVEFISTLAVARKVELISLITQNALEMMSTAKHHYRIYCYYPDATKADGFRCESRQIKALGDDQAISEASLYTLKDPTWFEIRKESKGDRQVIYNSKYKP